MTTVADEPEAIRLAHALTEERLAACVQRFLISSTYVWDGRVEAGAEYLLLVKTLSSRLGDVEKRIGELSTYEVPEIVTLETASVSAAYDAWLRSVCGS